VDVNKLLNDTANNKFIAFTITTYAENKKFVHHNNKDINIENLTITFHGKEILNDSNLKLN